MHISRSFTPEVHPKVIRALHWATLLVLSLAFGLILVRDGMEAKALRQWTLDLHRWLGVLAWSLACVRLVVRSRVTMAAYDDDARSWQVTLDDGSEFRTRFLITAIGPLSTPTLPRIAGRDSFLGQSFHTARWPHDPVDFTDKRVAVIGTGATGVQTIQTIAGEVGHLTVF